MTDQPRDPGGASEDDRLPEDVLPPDFPLHMLSRARPFDERDWNLTHPTVQQAVRWVVDAILVFLAALPDDPDELAAHLGGDGAFYRSGGDNSLVAALRAALREKDLEGVLGLAIWLAPGELVLFYPDPPLLRTGDTPLGPWGSWLYLVELPTAAEEYRRRGEAALGERRGDPNVAYPPGGRRHGFGTDGTYRHFVVQAREGDPRENHSGEDRIVPGAWYVTQALVPFDTPPDQLPAYQASAWIFDGPYSRGTAEEVARELDAADPGDFNCPQCGRPLPPADYGRCPECRSHPFRGLRAIRALLEVLDSGTLKVFGAARTADEWPVERFGLAVAALRQMLSTEGLLRAEMRALLAAELSALAPADEVRGLYRHYSGGLYTVLGTCRHGVTGEEVVVYVAEGDQRRWYLERAAFAAVVTERDAPMPRFRRIGPAEGIPTYPLTDARDGAMQFASPDELLRLIEGAVVQAGLDELVDAEGRTFAVELGLRLVQEETAGP